MEDQALITDPELGLGCGSGTREWNGKIRGNAVGLILSQDNTLTLVNVNEFKLNIYTPCMAPRTILP